MDLKEAARQVWIRKQTGHEMEFDAHWAFSAQYRRSAPEMWRMTIYPRLERDARRHQFVTKLKELFGVTP